MRSKQTRNGKNKILGVRVDLAALGGLAASVLSLALSAYAVHLQNRKVSDVLSIVSIAGTASNSVSIGLVMRNIGDYPEVVTDVVVGLYKHRVREPFHEQFVERCPSPILIGPDTTVSRRFMVSLPPMRPQDFPDGKPLKLVLELQSLTPSGRFAVTSYSLGTFRRDAVTAEIIHEGADVQARKFRRSLSSSRSRFAHLQKTISTSDCG